jgi:hypothetical protein
MKQTDVGEPYSTNGPNTNDTSFHLRNLKQQITWENTIKVNLENNVRVWHKSIRLTTKPCWTRYQTRWKHSGKPSNYQILRHTPLSHTTMSSTSAEPSRWLQKLRSPSQGHVIAMQTESLNPIVTRPPARTVQMASFDMDRSAYWLFVKRLWNTGCWLSPLTCLVCPNGEQQN